MANIAPVSRAVAAADQFKAACRNYGWEWTVQGSVITITKRFEPNNREQYSHCDSEAYVILSYAPLRGGSVWGTDGGSVGGAVALTNGVYMLKKSGTGKLFLAAL